jgi:hypothetical protein
MTKYGKKKPPPPPAPPKKSEVGEFAYSCAACLKGYKHVNGYIFVAVIDPNRMYFCNVNCYNDFLKANPEVKAPPPTPVTDRRGAIAATKAKEKENK